jgi:hypothetical protein
MQQGKKSAGLMPRVSYIKSIFKKTTNRAEPIGEAL